MKNKRFIRPIITGLAIGGIITALIWLNQPLDLPYFRPLDTVAQAESNDRQQYLSPQESPDVNPTAFRGQGKLAFIWKGLLYHLDGSTGEVKQLTDTGMAAEPAWSYDGEWLAFLQITDQNMMTGSLWLIRKDGSQAHQVQGLPGTVMSQKFSWSPTANRLSVSTKDGIWLVTTEGEPQKFVQTPSEFPSFSWSPDGKSLAYNVTLPAKEPGNMDDLLFTVTVDGGKPVEHLHTNAGIRLAGWHYDGKGLLFWLIPGHGLSTAADGVELYTLPLGETVPRPLTTGLTYQEWQSLSPQGKLLTVAGGGRIAWADKNIAFVDIKTGKVQNLPNPSGSVTLDPQFSPDGKRIAYVAAKNLGSDVWGFEKPEELSDWVASRTLYIANADGSNARAIPEAGKGIIQPIWSKDGSHILYVKDNVLWQMKAEGGQPEKIFAPVSGPEDHFGFYGFASYESVLSWYRG
ncbi:biopolymer transporter Tol [Desulfotomaculum sp. 1211_IL3151]|uniref:biopolymer transporter Tol n=1 Tax=Desulfotomaculum sp. 1211_IL3151 TaxID=3084055 RepID=UPI002FDB607F